MIYTHAAAAIGGAVIAGALAWNVQGWRYDAQIADIHTRHAAAGLKRSEAARADEAATAGKESTHTASTQENSDAFTTSQPVRDAIARADLAVAQRLRTDAERRAATYRAQAQACTTNHIGVSNLSPTLSLRVGRARFDICCKTLRITHHFHFLLDGQWLAAPLLNLLKRV